MIFTVSKQIKEEIDRTIKEIWLTDICKDYGNGLLIKEASLQCVFYHHLRSKLEHLLKENNLYIYPEYYFKDLKYRADLVIAEMDMSIPTYYLWERMTDIIAVIEFKYDGGDTKSTVDYIKTDKSKIREYVSDLPYDCQYYFGVIYETECVQLNWFDKRSTNNWASGRLTELNAGYLEEEMCFEVHSYNNLNFQYDKVICEIKF